MAITINGTTGLAGVDGSAGTPAVQGGDTNTGIFFPAADTVAIATGGTERVRTDSSGNVGIGTSSPSSALDVASSNSGITLTNTGASNKKWRVGGNASGYFVITESGVADRMFIDTSGNLLVGYTASNGAYKLQVNSQIFATSSTIATSDARYKENVTPLSNALSLVNSLNPVQFSWKQHPVHAFDRSAPTIGFLAQEVKTALAGTEYVNSIVKANTCTLEPEERDDDGVVTKPAVTEEFLGIAEGNLVALLTKAIQEQQALIQTLTARIEALEQA